MDKNFNLENAKNIIAEVSGVPVNTTFGSITKPIDLLLEVIDMSADLIALIREETELKKHHRAYLHVHEELEDCADEMAARMQEIFDETTDCVIGLMKDVHETFRVRKQEAAEDDADTVTIAKEDYETMIDDLLTMSEIIQCVADMRTQDVKAIREFGKFVPAFAACTFVERVCHTGRPWNCWGVALKTYEGLRPSTLRAFKKARAKLLSFLGKCISLS